MIEPHAVLSQAELLEEVLLAPRASLLELPEMETTRRPGWFSILTPSFPDGGFNDVEVAFIDGPDVDAVIDAGIAAYDARAIRFRWYVLPGARPADLGLRLAKRGLVASVVRGMAIATAVIGHADVPGVTVEEVDDANVAVATKVLADGFGTTAPSLERINRLALAERPRRHHIFLARSGGVPAGVASYAALPRSAYLLGAVVLPEFRGQGLYRQLVRERLVHAAAANIALAVTQARDTTSAPILERMGFETVCKLEVYSRP